MKKIFQHILPLTSAENDRTYKLPQLVLIGTLLVAAVVITNVIGTKVMTFLGFNFTAGVITYAAVFLGTDIIGEKWGKRVAYHFVLLGFLANLFLIIFVQLAIVSPSASFWAESQPAYEATLGSVWLIVAASMVAYLISQFHDVWAFDFWRKRTQGKLLWLRNILSTITSQFIDTIIFVTFAFALTLSIDQIFTIIVGQILIKWGLALIDLSLIHI